MPDDLAGREGDGFWFILTENAASPSGHCVFWYCRECLRVAYPGEEFTDPMLDSHKPLMTEETRKRVANDITVKKRLCLNLLRNGPVENWQL